MGLEEGRLVQRPWQQPRHGVQAQGLALRTGSEDGDSQGPEALESRRLGEEDEFSFVWF